jgi:hypothetical protein
MRAAWKNSVIAAAASIPILLGLLPSANAGIFGPDNYEECVLEAMKGVTSDMAARAIIGACRTKFPSKPNASAKSVDVPKSVLDKLTGEWGGSGTNFGGRVTNGDNSWTITEITFEFVERASLYTSKLIPLYVKRYTISVTIPPFAERPVSFEVDKNYEIRGIESAKGY